MPSQAGLTGVFSSFTRDSKSLAEREQALRFVRAVIAFPPPTRPVQPNRSPTTHSRHTSGPGHSRQSSSNGHSRHPSGNGNVNGNNNGHSHSPSTNGYFRNPSSKGYSRSDPDPIALLLEKRVPLTDGLVRAIVSSAENQEDPLRLACLETLVEIGKFPE